jgi:hypothetical protein
MKELPKEDIFVRALNCDNIRSETHKKLKDALANHDYEKALNIINGIGVSPLKSCSAISRDEMVSRLKFVIEHGVASENGCHILSAEKVLEGVLGLPEVEPVLTCTGCKHKGKFENEIEYGYNSPCTTCKRRVADNYERETE